MEKSTLGITSAKDYISELGKGSFTLQILNEQFRRIAPSLDIVSFYETVLTPIGFKNAKFMILEKESSVLEYPGEISKPLTNVDHHGPGRRSPEAQEVADRKGRTHSTDLRAILGITELPNTDYAFFRDQWVQGTGQWLLQDQAYRQWLLPHDQSPGIILLTGSAAAGKSVLASAVIHNLVADVTDRYCPYFFIHFADRKKRTLSLVLRSLAYQMGLNVPVFHEEVLDFADDAIGFDRADSRNIWDCIKFALSSIDTIRNSFHLLDYRWYRRGREAAHVTENLADLHLFHLPIRVLLVGRRTNELDAEFRRLPAAVQTTHIEMDGRVEDLAAYANRELTLFRDLDLRKSLTERVMEGAQNNFLASPDNPTATCCINNHELGGYYWQVLWLVMDAEAVLEELPGGMKALYDRMAASISTKSPPEREFATKLLQFAACSVRSLKVIELSRALST
ncbi:hypothetical protein MCOR30_001561 [Pyricularia oryzae]|nr:hypothetical protein MCOR30_001561 [Pyricularia oryzae]